MDSTSEPSLGEELRKTSDKYKTKSKLINFIDNLLKMAATCGHRAISYMIPLDIIETITSASFVKHYEDQGIKVVFHGEERLIVRFSWE